jgi:hypothetical protein
MSEMSIAIHDFMGRYPIARCVKVSVPTATDDDDETLLVPLRILASSYCSSDRL